MNGNEIEHIGGILEKPLPLQNGTDLFNHLYKEMKEEAKINKKDIESLHLKIMAQSQRGAVNFIFKAKLKIKSTELKERFKKSKKHDPDIAGLLFLKKSEYLNYLETCGRSVKKVMVELVD